jgi:hypothetical protein
MQLVIHLDALALPTSSIHYLPLTSLSAFDLTDFIIPPTWTVLARCRVQHIDVSDWTGSCIIFSTVNTTPSL